jgi:hypothetical protein
MAMERAEKATLYIFFCGIGVAVIAAAVPLAFPDASKLFWQRLVGVGIFITVLSAAALVYEYRHLAKVLRANPLIFICIVGGSLLVCEAWYFGPDGNQPTERKEETQATLKAGPKSDPAAPITPASPGDPTLADPSRRRTTITIKDSKLQYNAYGIITGPNMDLQIDRSDLSHNYTAIAPDLRSSTGQAPSKPMPCGIEITSEGASFSFLDGTIAGFPCAIDSK